MTFEEAIQRLASCTKAFETEAFDRAGMALSHHYEGAEDCCESEIEKIFYMAWALLLDRSDLFGLGTDGDRSSHRIFSPDEPGDFELQKLPDRVYLYDLMKPQYRALSYRVDFAVKRFMRLPWWDQVISTPLVVVECDGHDFHEKTKEQAARDKERDRLLQTAGNVVMRFTGSELWNDPEGCATQVNELLNARLIERAKAARDFKLLTSAGK